MSTLLNQVLQEYGLGEKCKIRDALKVEILLQRLITDGSNKLQVITDFDFTLTRAHKNGEKCCSAHRIIDLSPLMSPEYAEKAKVLVDKYVPIELDHNMTAEEKTPHIITWFRQSQVLLMDYQLTRDKIKEMVKTGNAHMRDLAPEVLSFLNDHNVPCLVFSAGQGDLVEALLHRDNVYFPNMKVVANFIVFNEAGECVSFKEPLIHVYNKNATGLNNAAYFEKISQRNNALVLGDSLGDVGMDKGMPDPGAVLKIGFLNDKIDERMDSFMDSYDVLLVDDQSFKFVDIILKKIVASK